MAELYKCVITNNCAEYGGGLFNFNGSINNCTISGNSAGRWGGGLCSCDGPITNCTIRNNHAEHYGGGLCRCDGSITKCTISGNSTGRYGGGFYQCDGPITNCTISNNYADDNGGGLDDCDGTIINCAISNNRADNDGGGLAWCYGPITNCTISSNSAFDDGGGLDDCDGLISNCIIWNNSAGHLGNNIASSSTPAYSCYPGGTGTNIDTDPCFADPCNGDYHLLSQSGRWDPIAQSWVTDPAHSPCIDAGDPASDYTSELWPHGKRVNMGACGNTPQASMSLSTAGCIADLDSSDTVDITDFSIFAAQWDIEQPLLPEDLTRDGKVTLHDFAIFIQYYLNFP